MGEKLSAARASHSASLVASAALHSSEDAVTFQRWLHAKQYPSDCSSTIGVRTRQDYFFALGLGAQMVSLKFNFLDALLRDRVYHFPTSHYVNPLRCKSRSFDCYFALPTNCTAAASAKPGGLKSVFGGGGSSQSASRLVHKKVEESKIHWCFDLPRRRLSRLAGLRAVHAKAWYHGQLAAFLYRPNDEMVRFGRELMTNMEGSAGVAAGGSGASSAAAAAAAAAALAGIEKTPLSGGLGSLLLFGCCACRGLACLQAQ